MINVKITLSAGAIIPTKGTCGSAGYDVYAIENGSVEAKQRSGLIPTGIRMNIPAGYYCEIKPRSGLAYKHGISVLGGIIDSDYVNEIFVILQNNGSDTFTYSAGDRIAQFIFFACANVEFNQVDDLHQSDRCGGFGSTGK